MPRYLPVLRGRTTSKVAVRNKYDASEGWGERRLIYIISLLIWVAVLSTGVYYTKQVLVSSIKKIMDPPISTQTRLVRNLTLVYPGVTLCYKNEDRVGYQEHILRNYGLTGYWKNAVGDYSNSTWATFPWGNRSLSRLWAEATYEAHVVEFFTLNNSLNSSSAHLTAREDMGEIHDPSMTILASLNRNNSALDYSFGYY